MLIELYALLRVGDSKLDKTWSLPSTKLMAKTQHGRKVSETKDLIGLPTDGISSVTVKWMGGIRLHRVCKFPQCKHSRHEQFQAPSGRPLDRAEKGFI